MTFSVKEHDGFVEVDGVTGEDVREGLLLLQAARTLQRHQIIAARGKLEQAMGLAQLDLVQPASLEQARRMAQVKLTLLASPAYTYDTLAEVRSDRSVGTTRKWVSRQLDKGSIVLVSQDGRVVLPAFQFTQDGTVRPELVPVLTVLMAAGVKSWELWVWLTMSSSLLSGGVPEVMVRTEPDRVLLAAERFAARR